MVQEILLVKAFWAFHVEIFPSRVTEQANTKPSAERFAPEIATVTGSKCLDGMFSGSILR